MEILQDTEQMAEFSCKKKEEKTQAFQEKNERIAEFNCCEKWKKSYMKLAAVKVINECNFFFSGKTTEWSKNEKQWCVVVE